MTKVLPLKSKKNLSDHFSENSSKDSSEESTVKSSSKKTKLNSQKDKVLSLEVLDPKLKAIQEAIDKGLYKIPSHMITESFLEKSESDTSTINKNTPKSVSANNVGRKLEILKKNKE